MEIWQLSSPPDAYQAKSTSYQRIAKTSSDNNTGYVTRGMHLLPKRGDKREWQHTQDYWTEKDEFPAIDLDDAAFVYG